MANRPTTLEPFISLEASVEGKPLVRFFVSYARVDMDAKDSFLHELQPHLQASGRYQLQLWQDQDILTGEQWHKHIIQELKRAHVGLLLISPGFLTNKYIAEYELPGFITAKGDNVLGKRLLPVQLKPIPASADLKGLDAYQIYGRTRGQSFVEQDLHMRSVWAARVAEQLEAMLNRYAHVATNSSPTNE